MSMETTLFFHNPVSGISHVHVKDGDETVPVNVPGSLREADAKAAALVAAPTLIAEKRRAIVVEETEAAAKKIIEGKAYAVDLEMVASDAFDKMSAPGIKEVGASELTLPEVK